MPKLIYPALCVWTWLFCFQAWFGSLSRTALLVLGLTQEEQICLQLAVWTGFQRISLAPGWEPGMQNPLPRHSKAFYTEGNACLCRGENIPFKRLVQVSGINSHRKRNVKPPPQQPMLSCLSHAVHPTHFSARCSTFITQVSHSPSPELLPKCNDRHRVSPHTAER